MGSTPLFTIADLINWGWLRIGPPYIYINIDPVILHLGSLKLNWYGLMYVVAILMALWGIRGYTKRKGMSEDVVYRFLWWCIAAGLVGGRLYFVIQQPDLVEHYLLQPWRILATWEGGMAFYGAIFLCLPTIFWRSRREQINPLVALDAGVLFGAIGQIFGRFGNLINGDIIGYPSTLPWSTVYIHPASWACLNPATCGVPVQPAAGYELISNLVLLTIMLILASRVRRPGILMVVYLFGYATTQFLVFFTRANTVVSFLGLDWGLKQAQWTSLVVFILLIPLTFFLFRYSKYTRPVPVDEVAATYGIPQTPKAKSTLIEKPYSDTDAEPSEDLDTAQNVDPELAPAAASDDSDAQEQEQAIESPPEEVPTSTTDASSEPDANDAPSEAPSATSETQPARVSSREDATVRPDK